MCSPAPWAQLSPNQFSFMLWSNSDSAPDWFVGVACQLSTRRSKSWRVSPEIARVWLPVHFRGRAKANRVGDGRMLKWSKSRTGALADALNDVASKDSTLAR